MATHFRSNSQGGETKACNGTARRMLVEAAWSYQFPARISWEQLLRQKSLPKPIRDTAWKAQVRLCGRGKRHRYGWVPARRRLEAFNRSDVLVKTTDSS